MNSNQQPVLPAVFVSHGSPMTVLDNGAYAQALAEFGRSVVPQSILVVSAHWQEARIRIASSPHPELIYDFGGFPRELYQIKYNSPGAPALAAEVASQLKRAGFDSTLDPHRGWDHGVWVPLKLMFPEGRIPVLAVSLPMLSPERLFEVGKALSALRAKGVLIVGSGGIVHNLRLMNWQKKDSPIDDWARTFQAWVKQRIVNRELPDLLDYEKRAPHAAQAAPTPEHFAPLFPVIGAAAGSPRLTPIFEGIEHANMSMFTFQLLD